MRIAPPARFCRYYFQGICIYHEIINPGLEESFRCSILAEMITIWDDFIDRAEVFGLSESVAGKIWASRMYEKTSFGLWRLCRKLPPPLTSEAVVECQYRLLDACLLAMPACSGHCGHYHGLENRETGPDVI